MNNAEKKALGIIFPNTYDKLVPELVSERLMASVPFASRYRMIDFPLSSMVNSGIANISILVRERYYSLIDHLGSGREWDLARKNGGLNIFPPYSEAGMNQVYRGRVDALAGIIPFLAKQKEKYVVLSDANIAYNIDFKKVIDAHIESNADVTILYTKETLPKDALMATDSSKGLYWTLTMDGNKVTDIIINEQTDEVVNFGMNVYVIERELLIEKIRKAALDGIYIFERDLLRPQLGELNVVGYEYDGYTARIASLKSFMAENLKLLEGDNLKELFAGNSIYTKIRDDNPTRYVKGSKVANIMAADGCVIEGEVENSVLFRGVKIGKGAVVKNCVLMQDTVVGEGAVLEGVITDKDVKVTAGAELKGTDAFPVFVKKGQTV